MYWTCLRMSVRTSCVQLSKLCLAGRARSSSICMLLIWRRYDENGLRVKTREKGGERERELIHYVIQRILYKITECCILSSQAQSYGNQINTQGTIVQNVVTPTSENRDRFGRTNPLHFTCPGRCCLRRECVCVSECVLRFAVSVLGLPTYLPVHLHHLA